MLNFKKMCCLSTILIVSGALMGCNEEMLISESVVSLPDVVGGEEGKGFTSTGLTYDENEGVFYIGNIGKSTPETPGFKSTIVKLSKDFKTNLGEINIYKTFPEMSDIQGLTLDKSDDTIWFCSFAENMLHHIDKNGEAIESIEFSKPIGIVYDSRTDTLWGLSQTELINMSKQGEIIKSISVSIEGQDQLWLDEQNNLMYFTAGNNYKGKNYVYTVNLTTDEVIKLYTLKDSHAVEGIYIQDNYMCIVNDGYYHDAKVKVNQINIYNLREE